MKFPVALLGLLTVCLAGCGFGSAGPAPTATPVPNKTYTDKTFHFTFKYPANWTLPAKGGHVASIGGVQTYIVPLDEPNRGAHIEVTVDGDVIQLPAFQEGHIAPATDGSPAEMQYFHAHLSGLPAMRIHRIVNKQIDEIDTIANTQRQSYDVRMITGTPPFTQAALNTYRLLTTSLQVSFS